MTRLAKKVLLIGWGAADWNVCQPLLDEGLMPNLERMVQEGASGKIAAAVPLLSPVLWTSLATGKRAYKHGIHGSAEADPDLGGVRAASSLSRTTNAIWNILTQQGFATHVIGWPGAHPAEPINGVNVTDQHSVATLEAGKPWPQPEASFHPPEVGPTLAALRIHPHQLDRAFLEFFVPEISRIDLRKIGRLTVCARWLAATVSTHAAATWAMEHRRWDFTAVCYGGLEPLSHAFMQHAAPRQNWISPEDFELYQHIVPACYRFYDQMLGRLFELAGDQATIILVSDHGFNTGTMRPASIGVGPEDHEYWHRREGVCIMKGPAIRRSVPIENASIFDLTPTILTLFDLPVGSDMDGRPLVEVVDADAESRCIPSWDEAPGDDRMHAAPSPEQQRQLQETLEQLREMGYSDPSERRLAEKQADVVARNRFNLARSLIEAEEPSKALEILEGLTEKSPPSTAVAALQIEACFMAGRIADARIIVERWIPEYADAPLTTLTLGRIELANGCLERALAYLHRAEQADGGNIWVHIFTGRCYLRLRRWKDATDAFQKARELQPEHSEALVGSAIACLRQHYDAEAMRYASAAIESCESAAAAHYYLGVAFTRLGRYAEAALALERAVRLDDDWGAARRRLRGLYEGVLKDETAAAARRRQDEQWRMQRQKSAATLDVDGTL